jgi:hypothetical protein
MKNRTIFLISMIVAAFFSSPGGNAKIIDNRVTLQAGYVAGFFHGKESFEDGIFKYPSLYSNMNTNIGFSLKALNKSHPNISWGGDLTFLHASNWKSDAHQDYQGAVTMMASIAPTIQFHNKYSEAGFFSSCKAYIELAPVLGIASLTLNNDLFQIHGQEGEIKGPSKSNDFYYGIRSVAGIEVAFSQSAGMFVSYSFQYDRVSSILYSDTHFTASQLNIGLVIKIAKDKRFYY